MVFVQRLVVHRPTCVAGGRALPGQTDDIDMKRAITRRYDTRVTQRSTRLALVCPCVRNSDIGFVESVQVAVECVPGRGGEAPQVASRTRGGVCRGPSKRAVEPATALEEPASPERYGSIRFSLARFSSAPTEVPVSVLGCATLDYLPGRFVCPVCYWEDDGSGRRTSTSSAVGTTRPCGEDA